MIYTVTLNPSIDYFVKIRNFEFGRTNRTTSELMIPGGKGINVSLMLHSLGMDSIPVGFTAGFVGQEIERLLQSEDINPSFIHCSGCSRINVKLQNFEGTEINGMGPEISEDHIQSLMEKLKDLSEGDYLVLAGSISRNLPDTIYSDLCAKLENRGIRIVIDATGQPLLDTLPYHPFLIKPNIDELSEVCGRELFMTDDIIDAAMELQDKGAENVLVSMGSKGAVLVDHKGVLHKGRAPEGHVVNAVGAGDSMLAGFLYGYEQSQGDYEEAFRYGIASGSASAFTQRFGSLSEVKKLMTELKTMQHKL